MTGTELEKLPSLPHLPDPRDLGRLVDYELQKVYTELAKARGTVHVPEDTYDMQRRLAAALELFREYARVFTGLANRVRQLQGEELVLAVGSADDHGHEPTQGLTVPDAAGDIRLTREMTTAHTCDLDQLLTAISLDHLGETDGEGMAVMRRLLELGSFTPQVTKVNAYAKELARQGEDKMAAVVRGTMTKTSEYKGLKSERVAK